MNGLESIMQLTIEKLVYGGDGLARLPGDDSGKGKAVFIPFVLAGEEIAATLIEQRPGFARGHLDSLLQASPDRVEPQCPHFTACGGCHYQHARYEEQLKTKVQILRENLRRLAKFELETEVIVHSASTSARPTQARAVSREWNYRNRARLALRHDEGFKLGYRRFASDEVLAVEECPIVSPSLQRAMHAIWKLGRDGHIPASLREVEILADAEDEKLMAVFHQAAGDQNFPERLIGLLREALPSLESIAAVGESTPSRKQPDPEPAKPKILAGTGFFTYNVGRHAYQVSVGAFFQSNRHLIPELVRIVTAGPSGNTMTGEVALDLYAGVGLFSLPLAENFQRVVAVESSPLSFGDLRRNLPPHAKAVRATTESYLEDAGRKMRADLIVVDPPRTGLGARVAKSLAQSRTPRITYVSCDPATLARDLAVLIEGGYRVTEAHLVDLFPQTFHLETVLHLTQQDMRK